MNRRMWLVFLLALVSPGVSSAQEDPGKTKVARLSVKVYHATDGDPKAAGEKAQIVDKETERRLNAEQRLRYKHYRLIGHDQQPLLRSYESWAQPLKPSDEVLVRFEAQGQPTRKSAVLDLELWLGRKKIVKTDARLEGDRPLFVLGPEWRGGRLIIAVALAPEAKPGS